MTRRPPVYGLLAEFNDPTELIGAIRRTRESGYRYYDAYTPFPIHEVFEAIGMHRNALPWLVLAGGFVGFLIGIGLQYWTSVIDYPINIGGRPQFSWPAFIPIIFECTVLFAAFAAVLGMLALNGLPMPYHPVFNVSRFAGASRDRFFLCIESRDPLFERDETRRFLERLVPRSISEVSH